MFGNILRRFMNATLTVGTAVCLGSGMAPGWGQASPASRDRDAVGNRWWAHVATLAADTMEGRGTGTAGYDRGSAYVIREFEKLGAEPGGLDGYRQPVAFIARTNHPSASSIVLRSPSGEKAIQPGVDAFFQMGCAQAESLEAEAVFVGYGIVAPEADHDDLRGLDLRGRIAVFLAGGPRSLPDPVKSYVQLRAERWSRFRAAGAVGWVAIPNPKDLDWGRYMRPNLGVTLALADTALEERPGLRFAITVNPARAPDLFEESGVDFASLLALADSGRSLPRFPLAVRIVARARYTEKRLSSDNIVAVISGEDPVLRKESIVLSAHLDHLGIVPQEGDSIMNGAMDNASGVAVLIEAARELRKDGSRRGRSIVLLANTGEEHGQLGSRYFAMHPPPRVGTIVANLNIDMFLPIAAFDRITVFGLDESSLGPMAREVAAPLDFTVQPDPRPRLNRFIRSDQISFVRAGIPALAFHSGGVAGSPIESLRTEWARQRYHAPSDDLGQPVDRVAAARFVRFYTALAKAVAAARDRPEWSRGSYFRQVGRGSDRSRP